MPREPEVGWDKYCGYECMQERLTALSKEGGCRYPIKVESIGKTVDDRHIYAIKIGDATTSASTNMSDSYSAPEVLMAGNIHGDETVGGQLLQRWIWYGAFAPIVPVVLPHFFYMR